MKSKSGIIWRLAVVVALVLAMVPVLVATPALASPEAQAVYLSPTGIELVEGADGAAEWSTAPVKTGSRSVKLGVPESYAYADEGKIVVPASGLTLDDITSVSYWYYVDPSTAATIDMANCYVKGDPYASPYDWLPVDYDTYGAPYLVIELDTTGDGSPDTWVVQVKIATDTRDDWVQEVIAEDDLAQPFHVAGAIPTTPSYNVATNWGTLDEIKDAVSGESPLSEAAVLRVKVMVGGWTPVGTPPEPDGPAGPVIAYVDDVAINDTTFSFEDRLGSPTEPLGALVLPTAALDAGSTYDLHLQGFEPEDLLYLDDIEADLLLPADSSFNEGDDTYELSPEDACSIQLDSDGAGVFYGVEPLYASDPSTYIGLKGAESGEFKIEVVASDYEGVSVESTATSFRMEEEKTFTVTVTKDDAALAGATVEVWLDSDMDGEGNTSLNAGFTTSAGERTFTVKPEKAGQIILVVGKDIGGKLGVPDTADGEPDIDNQTSKTTIDPIELTITSSPEMLRRSWAERPVYTVTTPDGENFTDGAMIELQGTPLDITESNYGDTNWSHTEYVEYATDGGSSDDVNGADGVIQSTDTFTPDATGTITVKASRDSGADNVPEYLGTLAQSVEIGAALNVDVSPLVWDAGDLLTLEVTILDSEQAGPDGEAEGSLLNWVKLEVSVPDGKTMSTGNWIGGITEDELGDAAGAVGATIQFDDVLPNDASSDIVVTVTGQLDTGVAVEPVTKTIPVSGYVVSNIMPDADQSVGDVSDISMTVSTEEDFPVNNALVTITAEADNGFQKEIDADLEGEETFTTIEIDGASGVITYDTDTSNPYPFLVNGGFYEVTGIEFAQVGDVEVEVYVDPDTLALFPSAFRVLGLDDYDLSFDPVTLTAGVDGIDDLEIMITDDGSPVTDVARIIIGEQTYVVSGDTPEDGVYTVDPGRYLEAQTVTASNLDETKYGTATLPVGLPSVTYEITEEVEAVNVVRDIMLVGEGNDYTIAVSAVDALGDPLAVGSKVWLGTYLEETFTFTALLKTTDTPTDGPADVMPLLLDADGSGEFGITQVVGDTAEYLLTAGLLVWKAGDSAVTDPTTDAALLPVPAITVAAPSYTLTSDIEEPMVGDEITFTVKDSYGEEAGELEVTVVTPSGDVVNKMTTPAGTFKYTGEEAGVFWFTIGDQSALGVTVYTEAELSIANLEVDPTDGEAPLTISASADVTNSGQATGEYTAALKIDGVEVDSQVVSVAGSTTETVTFSYTFTEAGTYLVTIDDLTADEVSVLAPTELSIANLVVDPTEGEAPLTISASADVTNSGDVAGDHTAELKVDGEVVDSEVVSVDGNTTVTVTFSYELTEAGTYLVTIDDLTAVEVTVSAVVLTLQLYEGANPILYEGATTDLPAALNNISDLAEVIWARAVWTDGEWWYYLVALDYSSNLTELENGKVYIVVVSEDCIWQLT